MSSYLDHRLKGQAYWAIWIIALVFVLSQTSCSWFTPKSAALEDIHETYRSEFIEGTLGPPGDQPQPASLQDKPAFAYTLRAIRDYRAKYGSDSPEAAHLTVLEGMIYVQSGQIGMARLIAPDVENAKTKLKSGTGNYTRDELFAQAYPHLLLGWQQIHYKFDNDRNTDPKHATMEQAANGLVSMLSDESIVDPSKINPEVDEGAIYLATTAAIFCVWTYKFKGDAGQSPNQSDWYTKGYEVMGLFMSDTEKNAAVGAMPNDSPTGRIRYLQWYGYLKNNANVGP
jgi:hypothetical protein